MNNKKNKIKIKRKNDSRNTYIQEGGILCKN